MAWSRRACLAVVNTRSGVQNGADIYARSLQHYLNQAGVTQQTITIPGVDDACLRNTLQCVVPTVDALVVCGGDGTVNTIVNMLARIRGTFHHDDDDDAGRRQASPHASPPLRASGTHLRSTPRPLHTSYPLPAMLVVPAGLRNSIAFSLGIAAPDRAVSCWVVGRHTRVPLWSVCVSGAYKRLMCSYFALGSLSDMLQRHAWLRDIPEQYMAVPAPLCAFAAATLYTILEHASVMCEVRLRCGGVCRTDDSASPARSAAAAAAVPKGAAFVAAAEHRQSRGSILDEDDVAHLDKLPLCSPASNGDGMDTPGHEDTDEGHDIVLEAAPLRLLVVSQMPFQQPHFGLTPQASFRRNRLSVTVATASATRLRMWHLMRREATEGYVDSDDGVLSVTDVTRVTFRLCSSGGGSAAEAKRGDAEEVRVLLDGEAVALKVGSEVVIELSDYVQEFLS